MHEGFGCRVQAEPYIHALPAWMLFRLNRCHRSKMGYGDGYRVRGGVRSNRKQTKPKNMTRPNISSPSSRTSTGSLALATVWNFGPTKRLSFRSSVSFSLGARLFCSLALILGTPAPARYVLASEIRRPRCEDLAVVRLYKVLILNPTT